MKQKMVLDSAGDYARGGRLLEMSEPSRVACRLGIPFDIGEFLDECGLPGGSQVIRTMVDARMMDMLRDEDGEPREKRHRNLISIRPYNRHRPVGYWSVFLLTPKGRAADEDPKEAVTLFRSSYEALDAVLPLVPKEIVKIAQRSNYPGE